LGLQDFDGNLKFEQFADDPDILGVVQGSGSSCWHQMRFPNTLVSCVMSPAPAWRWLVTVYTKLAQQPCLFTLPCVGTASQSICDGRLKTVLVGIANS